jgi:hypothetical protein
LDASAPESDLSSPERPSSPTTGLEEETWKADPMVEGVRLARALAVEGGEGMVVSVCSIVALVMHMM